MLHLARRIAFGVDVGDFLHLQRAFERDRIVNAAAEEEEVGDALVFLCQSLGLFFAGEQRLEFRGHAAQFADVALGLLRRDRAANLGEEQREDEHGRELRRERFGRSNADFRSGMGVDGAIRFARDHRSDDVADADRLRTLRLRLAQCGNRIGRLTRLRDQHCESI